MRQFKNRLLNSLVRQNDDIISIMNNGERIVPGNSEEWLLKSHIDRYLFANREITNKDIILDCACGVGYGTYLLAEKAKEVYGVDIDKKTIEYCKSNYSKKNIDFQTGNACKLDFKDDFFDITVSFETLEHVPKEKSIEMIKEFKRILKTNGRLYISTPNIMTANLNVNGELNNHFHCFELSVEEFYNFLNPYFDKIDIYGTRVRSKNKFNIKYLKSKLLRKLKKCDIQKIKLPPEKYHIFNNNNQYQHLCLIARCIK